MMQPHRRSNRRPRKNKTTQEEVKSRVQAFIEANRDESKEEDNEMPSYLVGFYYDKEMYMANDRYASMIVKELVKYIEDKLWDEAQKKYTEDEADHKDKFECKSDD